jgi:hypothetical protein
MSKLPRQRQLPSLPALASGSLLSALPLLQWSEGCLLTVPRSPSYLVVGKTETQHNIRVIVLIHPVHPVPPKTVNDSGSFALPPVHSVPVAHVG